MIPSAAQGAGGPSGGTPTIDVKTSWPERDTVTCKSDRNRWMVVAIGTITLLVAAIVPSPFRRRPGWQWVGPDKLLHLLGHAGYAAAIADALAHGGWSRSGAAAGAVAGSTVHSLATGRLQARVRGRADEPADVVAGLVGAASATLYWYVRGDGTDRGEESVSDGRDG